MRRNPDEYKRWQDFLEDRGLTITDDYKKSRKSIKKEIHPTPFHTLSEYDPALYQGRNVAWRGYAGKMIKVPAEYAVSIEGNIFDNDKIYTVMKLVEKAANKGKLVVFDAPLTRASVITLGTIAEDLKYEGNWSGVYHDRLLTTGDDELDRFIKDPELWSEEEYFDDSIFEVEDLFDQRPRMWPYRWKTLHDVWKQWNDGKLEVDDDYKGSLEKYTPIGEAMEYALKHQTGDLGAIHFQMRDGNHRTFGSLAAGEPYIWARLTDNELEDIKRLERGEEVWRPDKAKIIRAEMDRSKGIKLDQ